MVIKVKEQREREGSEGAVVLPTLRSSLFTRYRNQMQPALSSSNSTLAERDNAIS